MDYLRGKRHRLTKEIKRGNNNQKKQANTQTKQLLVTSVPQDDNESKQITR